MKKRRLQAYVEIVTPQRRKHSEAFSPESSPETEPVSPNLSPTKKRRLADNTLMGGLVTVAQRRLALHESPTVSEFSQPFSEGLRLSPTVSDFGADARELSPTVSDFMKLDGGPSRPDMSYLDIPSEVTIYNEEDDLQEDENLEVEGETVLDEDDSDYDSDEVPVRILDDFSIYDAADNSLIFTGQLTRFNPRKDKYLASGRVRVHSNIQDDDTNDGISDDTSKLGERVKLSRVLELNVHYFTDDEDGEKFDSKIYIRTRFAWYILASPSIVYTPFFLPFFVTHQICHLYLSNALVDPDLTLEDFLHNLPDQETPTTDGFPTPDDLLGRPIVAKDVESDQTVAYLCETLPTALSDSGLTRLKRTPLIANILGSEFDDDYREDGGVPSERSSSYTSGVEDTVTSTSTNIAAATSKPPPQKRKGKFTPVVTPTVKAVSENMFFRPLQLAGESLAQFRDADKAVIRELDEVQAHHELDPESMVWGPRVKAERGFYESVELDGVEYKAGDVVMVHYDENSCMEYKHASNYITSASYSVNSYANRVWFCRICYFFEERDIKRFHCHWFHHGSKTILQETAHSKGLFLGETCDDVNVATIIRKCEVHILEPGQDEPQDDKSPNGDKFFCSLMYDEDTYSFFDVPRQSEIEELFELLPRHKSCHACGLKEKWEISRTPTRSGDSFTYQGIIYHPFDFVYVKPASGTLLNIAQIIKFEPQRNKKPVEIQYLARYDDFKTEGSVLQERRLVLGGGDANIDFPDIDGKCFVKHLEDEDEINEWIKSHDHYFLRNELQLGSISRLDPASFQSCENCLSEREEEITQRQTELDKHGPLRGLELFSGAGGLGTGLDMSQFVDTRWAVEINGPAAKSYQKNHPEVTVYCQDTNALLQHAIETHEGRNPDPLPSNLRGRSLKSMCPKMPKKGEVDIIYGGPPCQAFSRANHVPRVDDIRCTLPTNMLSYLEFYEPDYFLLENVVGLLGYSCRATQKSVHKISGGIEMGMVKLIVRALLALGYQARFKILQAGQYGCPQSRQRIIFFGARRGLKLPEFPIPTHAFWKPAHNWNLPIDRSGKQKLYAASRSRDPHPQQGHACAPLKPVSVNQAVSDLRAFEWMNPHLIIPARQNSEDMNEGALQCSAILGHDKDLPGYLQPTSYARNPCNAYQRWLRTNWSTGRTTTRVTGHYTPLFGAHIIEASVSVPLKPLADDQDLPLKIREIVSKSNEKRRREEKPIYPRYGRLDGDSYFKTALTSFAPNLKCSYILHPSQRRTITYREAARAQGFPDHYEFLSEDRVPPNKAIKDIYKQIGNAVPVPLALALGLVLGDAMIDNWRDRERAGSPEV
ncbi:hypothetical protein D9758_000794 [Tetrapyrgos nigripes]|uniref:Cytosine-specific methyltransferase n=1 Tax=Tetrapyrgos nigripes TaxID=182062 RepID=A0A8H5GZW6_9AGAR|nr:hypothetical protein D9758_000794 [Tetrapyrgos nigripes]